ncbi:MAG: flagellar motor switch protein FliN [Hyphomicrobiales bacterium]|nr:flagellar motor switch protein FliN [Hyphomicrobiales bacterium]
MKTNTKKADLGNGALDMNTIRNIKVDVQAVLGGISMSVSKLSHLKEGELVSLEKNIGEEIEILANGQLIAHGEIVVIEGDTPKFGITLTSIVGSGSHK